jgi:uncharacterized protein YdcH (DUF465 family)
MSHTAHELTEEFPAEAAKIRDLKASDAHFAKLVAEYHTVNRAVHRAETRVDVLDSASETELRQKRMHLKDDIFRHLNAV